MQSANEWCDISTWCMCIVQLMWYRSNFKMLGTYTIRCLFENLTPSLHTFITFFYTLKIEILNAFISDAQWKWLIYNTDCLCNNSIVPPLVTPFSADCYASRGFVYKGEFFILHTSYTWTNGPYVHVWLVIFLKSFGNT